MKQIIQHLRTGDTILEEIPVPVPGKGQILVRSQSSLVSLGTERMLVEFGRASLMAKARQQPERVKMVLDKIKSDGLLPTLEAVFNKLDQPLPLGYCNAGVVEQVGEGVSEFKVGDRVATNGPHAEFVCVPKHLAAHIPDNVTSEEAAFTVISSIGLQGIRLLHPTLGETIVVTGLGLIGLITAELLKANGCRVIGIDPDANKRKLAEAKGIIAVDTAQDVVATVLSVTGGIGADGVIITASAKTDEIISQAARMSRKRGRIILVGVIGLQLNRAEFYDKELSFQVSCSYGPGRYDEAYEQQGHDYPIGFVRWTEQRNFEAVLQAISSGQLKVKELITERVALAEYQQIYNSMGGGSIASILQYPAQSTINRAVKVTDVAFTEGKGTAGIIGAGNFTRMTLLPAFKKIKAPVKYIVSAGGVNSSTLSKKFGIAYSTTAYEEVLKDSEVELVIITTRHHLHADMVKQALLAGKHVFVEKPLSITLDDLNSIKTAYTAAGKTVTVGFNRRFAPLVQKMKKLLGDHPTPMTLIANMNAGNIPLTSWVQDMKQGGGRIIGEACHHIDLLSYLCGSPVTAVCMNAMGVNPAENTDTASMLLRHENGSMSVVNYFSNGSKAYSKERIEAHHEGRTLVLDNFRSLKGYGYKNFSSSSATQNKGHQEQFQQLFKAIEGGNKALIPFEESYNATLATFAAIKSLQTGEWVKLSELK